MEVGAPRLPAPDPRCGTLVLAGAHRAYAYGAITLYGGPFQATSASPGRAPGPHGPGQDPITPHPPRVSPRGLVWAPPLSLAATRGIPYWFLFLPLLGCFLSGGSRSLPGAPGRAKARPGRRSHSGIPGSTPAHGYPGLIAACHALRRRPSRAIHQAGWRAGPTPEPTLGATHGLCVAVIVSVSWGRLTPLRPSPHELDARGLHFSPSLRGLGGGYKAFAFNR